MAYFCRTQAIPRRVDHIADLEPIKLARGANRVRAHVFEGEPVPNGEIRRKASKRTDAVDRVASGSPDAACLQRFRCRNVEGPVQTECVRRYNLVIEEYAVERAVYTIIDVVCNGMTWVY